MMKKIKPRTLTTSEKYFFALYLVGTLISLIVIALRNYGEMDQAPFDNFLTSPSSRFGDFYGVNDEWTRLGWDGVGYGLSYFPTMYFPVEILSWTGATPRTLAIFYLLLFLLITIKLLMKLLVKRSQVTKIAFILMIVTSYPILMVFATANLEGIPFLFCLLWLNAIKEKRYRRAAVYLGIATACKLIPGVFFLFHLFKVDKKDRFSNAATFMGAGVLTSVVAIIFLPTGVLSNGIKQIVNIYNNTKASQTKYYELMFYSESGTHFGHSFLNGVHALFGENTLPSREWGLLIAASLVIFILSPLLLSFFVNREIQAFDVLLVSSCIACLAPPTSTDYKLWYFLIPILYIASLDYKVDGPWYLYLIALLLFAKPYLYTGVQPWASATAYIPPITMILLILSINFQLIKDLVSPKVSKLSSS